MWCSGTLNAGNILPLFLFLNRKVRKDFRKVHNDCKVFLIGRFQSKFFYYYSPSISYFEPMKG
jgi:hypothetical protein